MAHGIEPPRVATPSATTRRLRWLAISITWVSLVVGLEREVLFYSFAQQLARERPELALLLDETNAAALQSLAARVVLNAANPAQPTPGLQEDAASPAIAAGRMTALREALRSDLLNSDAWSSLAVFEGILKNEKEARLAMTTAARLDQHNTLAQISEFQRAVANDDVASAIAVGDVLMRTSTPSASLVMPMFGKLAENSSGIDKLVRVLSEYPPWRGLFMESIATSVSQSGIPLNILVALRATNAPPTTAEASPYVRWLAGRGDYALAYYVWLQFLSQERLKEVRVLYNGSFNLPLSTVPFDWQIRANSGSVVEPSAFPNETDKRGLRVVMGGGRVQFDVTQVSIIVPGRYRLSGMFRSDFSGPRGLRWRVACLKGAQLGLTPQLTQKTVQSQTFSLTFIVPEKDCDAIMTTLSLDSRSDSEQLATGSAWFTDLRIVDVEGEACRDAKKSAPCE